MYACMVCMLRDYIAMRGHTIDGYTKQTRADRQTDRQAVGVQTVSKQCPSSVQAASRTETETETSSNQDCATIRESNRYHGVQAVIQAVGVQTMSKRCPSSVQDRDRDRDEQQSRLCKQTLTREQALSSLHACMNTVARMVVAMVES